MPRTKIKQSPKQPAEQRRQQLLDAAGTLFLKKGYRGTTTEEIAKRVGLTKGAFYFHFKNKEEILFDLVKHMHEEMARAVAAIPAGTASPAQLLAVLLGAKPKVLQADFVGYLDFWIQASKIPKIKKYLSECMGDYDDRFASRISSKYAPSKKERHEMAIFIISLYDGLTVRHLISDRLVDFKRQVRLLESLTGIHEESKPKSKKK